MNVEQTSLNEVTPSRTAPGKAVATIVTLSLVAVALVALSSRSIDPLYPLNDPAIRNLLTLIFSFIAGFTLWLWFCFFSSHAVVARRSAFIAPLVLIGVGGLSIYAVGLGRLIRFSGSMTPRLAPVAAALDKIEPAKDAALIDLKSTTPADYSQFLGPARSNWIAGPELSRDWTANPPKLLWKRPIGDGWSAFAAVNGYAVTIEQRGAEEWVTCYEIATGKPMWGQAIEGRHDNAMGGIGPRSTPTIDQGRIYALGATGVLRCLDGATGQSVWSASEDLRKRYGVDGLAFGSVIDEQNVKWGRAASPLIVDQLVVVPGGGPAGKAKNLVAFEAATGKLVWEAENQKEDGTADQIAYASPALATLCGRRQIIIVNESTASGHDPATGKRLWSFPWPGHSNSDASSSQAVAIDDSHVLLSKGYSGGAELVSLAAAQDGTITAKSAWKMPRSLQTKLTNVVVKDGHAYGLSEGILECIEVMSGKRKWKSGRYGHGQILGVGDLLLVISEEGELHLIELNPRQFQHLASLPAIQGKTWNNLCLYGRQLLVRNAQEAACYELP